MGESGRVTASDVVLTPDGRIEGSIITVPKYVENYQRGGSVKMYFSAVMDAEPSSVGTFVEGQVFPDRTSQEGVGAGLYVTFQDPAAHPKVEVKVGLSYTSVSNARLNLETEARRLDFDRARKKAERRWEENFRRIRVEGGLREDRVKFYTGLFHALLGRGLASDVNGAYPAHDGSIGQIPLGADGRPVHNHYNTDAIWGAFWNLTQLWTLAWPACYSDWISSQLLVYKDAGWLGDGIACSHYVSGVGTNFVGLAIAAAYNCGIRDFDVALGYEAARKDALESRDRPIGAGKLDIGPFVRQGWSPYRNGN
jgi:putative alpha-1,2-mannosidase